MADEDDPEDEMEDEPDSSDEDGEDGEGGEGGGGSGKKKLLIIIGVVLLLVIGGIAAAFFTGALQPVFDMLGGSEPVSDEMSPVLSEEAVFYDLPELLVNINTGTRKSSFLKIRVSLELQSADDIPRIEGLMPRVMDNFQVYLRELRVEDLKGSAGMYRLREELLKRVSIAVAPVQVNDVLFKEMLVQ